jgi:hypothetical protein
MWRNSKYKEKSFIIPPPKKLLGGGQAL